MSQPWDLWHSSSFLYFWSKKNKEQERRRKMAKKEGVATATRWGRQYTQEPRVWNSSVLVCVCATLHNPSRREGARPKWRMKSWLFQNERFTVGHHFDNTSVKSCVFAWRDAHKWHCSVQSDMPGWDSDTDPKRELFRTACTEHNYRTQNNELFRPR